MVKQHQFQRWRSGAIRCLLVCVSVLWLGQGTEVSAFTTYTYADDQGVPVYTDDPGSIPEQYRAQVKTIKPSAPMTKAPSARPSLQEQAQSVGSHALAFQAGMLGLRLSRSGILPYAGVAVIVLLLAMFVCKNRFVRMIGFSLLLAVGIGTSVFLYVSDGGPMDVMKAQATAATQAQQDYLQQIPQDDPPPR